MSDALFHAILDGVDPLPPELDRDFQFYPLTSPGMPLPGPNFIAAARWMRDPPEVITGTKENRRLESHGRALHFLYRRALYDADFRLNVNVRGSAVPAPFVPGHLLADTAAAWNGGPRPARVMLIGKHPGKDEVQGQRNFIGPTSVELFDALDELGVGEAERGEWYATNLCKWPQLDLQSDTIPTAWKNDSAILLEQEIRLVRPDYILCLGSDASKFLLGTNCGVQSMVGRVASYTVSLHERGERPEYHTAKVMAVTHPAQVYRRPEMFDEFKAQIGLFISLTNGADIGGREHFVNHRNIYKARELKAIVDEIRSDPDPMRRLIAIDGEWEGDHPSDPGSYLRTIQFSSKHGEGYTVVLRYQGGKPAFRPSIAHGIAELKRLFKYDPENNWYPRIGGHFFRADLPWLIDAGLDLRPEYAPAERLDQCRDFGGWDSSVMYHAVNECASYGLEDMTAKLTTAPRYDEPLMKWRAAHCKAKGIKEKDLDGYGMCPPWILHPEPYEENPNYASYDPDVTRRIAVRCMAQNGLLDHDWFGNNSWEPYWVAHRASVGFLEMEMNGIMLDKKRVDELTSQFIEAHTKLLAYFRHRINWPQFNPRSHPQCRVFLFGERHSGKVDKATGRSVDIMPPGAVSLNMEPVTTTGKRPKVWVDVVARGEQAAFTPSTNKEVLGALGHQNRLAMILRDIKFVAQVLSTTLRHPVEDETGEQIRDEEDNNVYTDGVPSMVHADGRIHTHLSQCKETGRASSYRPNLQSISKRREGDYSRILGYYKDGEPKGDYLLTGRDPVFDRPLYTQAIRSVFRAAPGCALVECDYTGAELAVLAWMCGDPRMIDHVRRNILPDTHPDHYDIHAQTAVRVFHLPCVATKKGMGKQYGPLRVAAKNVNFGIPYGRAAAAIARQCREEGVDITVEDTQRIIDFYFEQYPGTDAFLQECRDRSQDPKWLCTCFGRYRRFVSSRDHAVQGEQERQAQNAPIQGTVADAVSTAVYNFDVYRREHPDLIFWRALQIHDALLFEVPISHLRRFVHDETDAAGNVIAPSVLRECMINRVPIWPRRLNNTPMPGSVPYYFGIDYDVSVNWGQELTEEQEREFGLAA